MKKNINGVIYVQKLDIKFLRSLNYYIPDSLYVRDFISGNEVIDETNEFEYVGFEDKDAIEYFNNLKWIFDVNVLSSLPSDDVFELRLDLIDRKHDIDDKIKNGFMEKELLIKQKIIDLQLYSLYDFISDESGCIYYNAPNTFASNNLGSNSKRGVVRLVRSLFNNKGVKSN